jgi:hypothetical protein
MPVKVNMGFENLEKGSIILEVQVITHKNFRIRMWLMRQMTKAYFSAMSVLSKGVVEGKIGNT